VAAYCSNINQTQHRYLGKETDHNVYAAELEGIGLMGKILQQSIENYTQCLMHMDSQAAIKAIGKPKHQSGQATIKRTLDILDNVKRRKPNVKIPIKWVPGHQDIEGNEKADQAAKHAANNGLASWGRPAFRTMKSAQYQQIQKETDRQWMKEWRTGNEDARKLRNIQKRPHIATGTKLYQSIQNRKYLA